MRSDKESQSGAAQGEHILLQLPALGLADRSGARLLRFMPGGAVFVSDFRLEGSPNNTANVACCCPFSDGCRTIVFRGTIRAPPILCHWGWHLLGQPTPVGSVEAGNIKNGRVISDGGATLANHERDTSVSGFSAANRLCLPAKLSKTASPSTVEVQKKLRYCTTSNGQSKWEYRKGLPPSLSVSLA